MALLPKTALGAATVALVAVLMRFANNVIPERIAIQWLRHAPVVLLAVTVLLDISHAATSKAKVRRASSG